MIIIIAPAKISLVYLCFTLSVILEILRGNPLIKSRVTTLNLSFKVKYLSGQNFNLHEKTLYFFDLAIDFVN